MSELSRAWIALGANLGEPRAALNRAIESIARLAQCRLVARSSHYRSAPVDAPGQPDYWNAVVALDTGLEPLALLHALQQIEQANGRERSFRNAPRTLDLDLLLFGDISLATDELTLPHPRMHLRAFVLAPLAEINADLKIPGYGRVAALLPSVRDQQIERVD